MKEVNVRYQYYNILLIGSINVALVILISSNNQHLPDDEGLSMSTTVELEIRTFDR